MGDTICVNGKVWPYLNVEPKRYRFLFINGSNARTYEMFLTKASTKRTDCHSGRSAPTVAISTPRENRSSPKGNEALVSCRASGPR